MPDPLTAWIEAALAEYPADAMQERLRIELKRRIRMLTMTGVRAGFTTVTPYLTVVEIERLIAFAKEAFGAVETFRSTGSAGGTHCELRIGDSMLMCGGGEAARGHEKLAALHVLVPDVDAVYRRALEAGADPVAEPEDKPYGARQGSVQDSIGNRWIIATHHGPVQEPQRTVTPFLVPPSDAIGLIEFLKAAFHAEEMDMYKSPEGKLEYAALRIQDAVLEFGEAPGFPQSAFYLYVPDADAVYQDAVGAGAKPLYPPADQPYGDRVGGVVDSWGGAWYIATHLGSGQQR
jgi:PhnB protein